MKTLKCYDCDKQFESETRDDILSQLYTHYMKEHLSVITGAAEAEKKRWMEQFEKDWKSTSEV